MATESDEPQAPADTTVIVPVTDAIYHNGNEKPTERWCFELGLMIGDRDFASILGCLQKGFGINIKCAMLNIVKCKIQLSSKDFQPKLPEWQKGRIFQIDTPEQWRLFCHRSFNSLQREITGKLKFFCFFFLISSQKQTNQIELHTKNL